MGNHGARSRFALGFLTVLDHAEHGLFGGYLVLNTSRRPLEFHCTAPIRPNRAQEILYGPTLEPFLYGEQIGQTLLEKGKIRPSFVCTDRQPVMAVREHVALPVALVLPAKAGAKQDPGEFHRVDAAHGDRHAGHASSSSEPELIGQGFGSGLMSFQLGQNRLAVPMEADADRKVIAECLAGLAESFDLTEPFSRIRQAIEEAQHAV